MPVKIRISYSRVTEESALHGDYSEHGWYIPGGWHFPSEDETASEHRTMSARDAFAEIRDSVGSIDHAEIHGDRASFYGCPIENYTSDHQDETRCAHLVGSPRLLRAIARELGVKA